MALAPLDTEGRICSAASGSRLWSWRSWFRQRMKSGAVSIRVPSRSNSTAEGFWSVFTNIPRVHQVVYVDITAQLVAFGDGVVGHTGKLAHVQPGVAQVVGHFRGPDELLPLVGALGQHVQHVFRAHNGKQEGLRVTVDGRHKQVPARAQHGGTRLDDRGRVRNVFQHFQAGNGIILAGVFRVPGKLLDGGLAVVHLHTGFHAVQLTTRTCPAPEITSASALLTPRSSQTTKVPAAGAPAGNLGIPPASNLTEEFTPPKPLTLRVFPPESSLLTRKTSSSPASKVSSPSTSRKTIQPFSHWALPLQLAPLALAQRVTEAPGRVDAELRANAIVPDRELSCEAIRLFATIV